MYPIESSRIPTSYLGLIPLAFESYLIVIEKDRRPESSANGASLSELWSLPLSRPQLHRFQINHRSHSNQEIHSNDAVNIESVVHRAYFDLKIDKTQI